MLKRGWQSPGLAAAMEQAGMARYEGTNKLMDEQAAARASLASQTKPDNERDDHES